MPSEPISIRGYAKTVDAMCDALGVERVSVVGNSMGGFIGAELALVVRHARGPARARLGGRALTTEHLARAAVGWRRRGSCRPALAGRARASSPRSCAGRGCAARVLQGVFRYPERLSAPLAQELVLSAGKPGFVPALEALLDYSYRDRLGQIEIPVLIVWGRNDLLVPVGDAYRYQRADRRQRARRSCSRTRATCRCSSARRASTSCCGSFLAGDPAPESEVAGTSGPSATGA